MVNCCWRSHLLLSRLLLRHQLICGWFYTVSYGWWSTRRNDRLITTYNGVRGTLFWRRTILFANFIQDLNLFWCSNLLLTSTFARKTVVYYESRFVNIKMMSWWELSWLICHCLLLTRRSILSLRDGWIRYLVWALNLLARYCSLFEILVFFSYLLIKSFLAWCQFLILAE